MLGYPAMRNINIHFVTRSNQTNANDMMEPVVAELEQLEKGVVAFDAHLEQEVLVVAPVIAFFVTTLITQSYSITWVWWKD